MKRNGTRKGWRTAAALLLAAVMAFCACAALADGGWVCPQCGRENTDDMNFCGGCRTPKPAGAAVAASGSINAWICSACGKACPEEDSFCTNCGGDPLPGGPQAVLIREPELQEVSFQPCGIDRYRLSFASADDVNVLDFTAPVSGAYYFWIEDQRAEFAARMYLNDDKGKELVAADYPTNHPSLYTNTPLQAGGKYTVSIRNAGDSPDYTLCIGIPRDPVVIPEASLVRDSLVFTDQDNAYLLTPTVTGRYRFDMYEVRKDSEPNIIIEDDLGFKKAGSNYGVTMGSGVNADLEAGKTYIVHVRWWNGSGEYVMRVGTPRAPVDVTGSSAFGDSIWYDSQINEYWYTASKTGEYRLRFGMTRDHDEFTLAVDDDLGHNRKEVSFMQQGNELKVELEAGRRYTFRVTRNSGEGPYTVMIEEP